MSFFRESFTHKSVGYLLTEVLKLIWEYPLYMLSFCTPRYKNKWICGSGNSLDFSGNPKYFYFFMQDKREVSCIWISAERKIVRNLRELRLPAYYLYSLTGLFHALTAKVYVYENTLKDICFFTSGNTTKINLWHGTGLKKMVSNKVQGSCSKILARFCKPYFYKKADLLIYRSIFDKDLLFPFAASKKTIVFRNIYPRCSFLCTPLSEITRYIQKYESLEITSIISNISEYRRVFIYMPTYRGYYLKEDFLSSAGFDLDVLESMLTRTNQLFIIKLHFAHTLESIDVPKYNHIIFLPSKSDVYPILPFTDVLITDYSSIFFDYLMLEEKGILLYTFDLEQYEKEDNQLLDIGKYMPAQRANNFHELLSRLEDFHNNYEVQHRKELLQMFHGDFASYSVEQIYDKILSIVYNLN